MKNMKGGLENLSKLFAAALCFCALAGPAQARRGRIDGPSRASTKANADVSRAKRAERVDSAAAAFILQGAIDAMVG